MPVEASDATFGAVLREGLAAAGHNQVWLSDQLGTHPSHISRWIHNKAVPQLATLRKIDELLGTDLSEAFGRSQRSDQPQPIYDLFVSTQIYGLNAKRIGSHHREVERFIGAAEQVVGKIYWPGKRIHSSYDVEVPDLATKKAFEALASSAAYMYLELAGMTDPSDALVELGFALGRGLKTTMIIEEGLKTPYMFEGLQGIPTMLDFFPEVHIYRVGDIDDAIRLIERNGRELLLPGQTDQGSSDGGVTMNRVR